jgi:hypothetical protein
MSIAEAKYLRPAGEVESIAAMQLHYFYAVSFLLGAIGLFILAPIQKRAGKTKHFWMCLVLGVVVLVMAISNF